MRRALQVLVPVLALMALGCGGTNVQTAGNRDGGSNLDGHLEQNPGQMGSSCATACDCQPGLSCVNDKCGTGGAAYYCCESTSCPAGSMCQSSSGALASCGSPSGSGSGSGSGGSGSGGSGGVPGLDGGLGGGGLPSLGDGGTGGLSGACGFITCTSDTDCSGGIGAIVGCTACDTTTGTCK
jgi:hypothetical protein